MTEPPLRRLARCPVAGLLAPGHSITQLALDRRHEPPQAVLDDVVVRPRPHCRYRHLLAEGAGNEDKGNIELALVQRSEEHTSELQSLMRISYAVFCLKKKKTITSQQTHKITSQQQ